MLKQMRFYFLLLSLVVSTHSGYGQILSGYMRWVPTGPQEAVLDITSANAKDFVLTAKGLYATTDDVSWQKLKSISSTEFYYSVVALPSGELFLFSYSYYSISKDFGATWKKVNQPGFSTRTCIADNIGYLYAGENDPIQLSTDKGVTWKESKQGTSGGFFDIGVIATDPGGNVFAGNQGITGGMVYRSSDHGSHWQLIHSETMKDVYCLAANNSSVWISYSDRLLFSDDTGATWKTATPTPAPVTTLLFTGENEGFAGMANGRILYTADRGNGWDDHMAGIHGKSIACLSQSAANKILVGTDSGLFIPTGIPDDVDNDPQEKIGITLTPNSARNDIHITISGNNFSEMEFGIYDLLGRKMPGFPETITAKQSILNTSSLEKGVYYVIIHSKNEILTTKLIIGW